MTNTVPYFSDILNKKTNEKFICLIQLISKNYISYYTLKEIKKSDQQYFLKLVDTWWKNSPNIPISLYYKSIFDQFNYCKHHLANNDYVIEKGFCGNKLKNLSEKRIKRKLIHID